MTPEKPSLRKKEYSVADVMELTGRSRPMIISMCVANKLVARKEEGGRTAPWIIDGDSLREQLDAGVFKANVRQRYKRRKQPAVHTPRVTNGGNSTDPNALAKTLASIVKLLKPLERTERISLLKYASEVAAVDD